MLEQGSALDGSSDKAEVDNIAVLLTSNSADRLHRDWKGSEALLLTQDQALNDDTTALIIMGFARVGLPGFHGTQHTVREPFDARQEQVHS